MPFVMGTAGHIDHGKTTLVKALTGVDCDRLDEEKRRGITIELGFAHADLPGGIRLGIIDMPGHERFVRTMAAGASGIDFVLLVIAADEGVMPQTREHLEICTLLGIRRGIVALTKADLAGPDMLELAREEAGEFLKGTFLEGAPVHAVSAATGQGIAELRQALLDQCREEPRKRPDIFRLPVDRVFTMKGHGTVVTGSLLSGSASAGDEVELLPSGMRAHIRAMQSHGEPLFSAEGGRRLSLNLGGLSVGDISRGDVVTHPGTMTGARRWLVRLTCLPSSPRALRHRAEVHFHHSARELPARLYFCGRERLAPGETDLAEVHFPEDAAGMFGDRCIIRSFSPLRTVAGGTVICCLDSAPRRTRLDEAARNALSALAEDSDEEARLALQLRLCGARGLGLRDLTLLTGLGTRNLEKRLSALAGRGAAFCWDRENRLWISAERLEELFSAALEAAAAFHAANPLETGMARGTVLSGLGRSVPARLGSFVIERLLRSGRLTAEGDSLRLPGHRVSLAAGQEALLDAIRTAHLSSPLLPPGHGALFSSLGITAREARPIFRMLTADGTLVKVREDLYYPAQTIADLRRAVIGWFGGHDELSIADFRELSGISRKNGVSLLEYFDKEQLTMRVGDNRVLRGRRR